jgi:hypothetical protein
VAVKIAEAWNSNEGIKKLIRRVAVAKSEERIIEKWRNRQYWLKIINNKNRE